MGMTARASGGNIVQAEIRRSVGNGPDNSGKVGRGRYSKEGAMSKYFE